MELIKLEDIHKTYFLGQVDVPVLKGVSLTIDRGELVALMGVSGSGKTTLMNLLGCLDRPTSGRYWLDSARIDQMSADQRALVRNRKIGFVFQNFNLLARTSALDNVMMPLSYTAEELSEKEWRHRAEVLLRRVGLGERMDHEPSQLSGGQQQRVAIARALVNNPPLLLADEPTGALDSRTSEEILALFQHLNAEEGITIILVTHDANVASHAKRIIRIKDGLIQDDGVPCTTPATNGQLHDGDGAPQSGMPRLTPVSENGQSEAARVEGDFVI
jgi:ABC-type lipoprotein export system ATPase subunit